MLSLCPAQALIWTGDGSVAQRPSCETTLETKMELVDLVIDQADVLSVSHFPNGLSTMIFKIIDLKLYLYRWKYIEI